MGLILVTPLLWLFVALIIQYGLWAHAGHVVRAAAQEGARSGAVMQGTVDGAKARALDLLSGAGNSVEHPNVNVERSDTDVRVVVTGQAVAVVPGLHLRVHATAVSPVERFQEAPSP